MLLYSAWAVHRNSHVHIYAVVAQSVERFLGNKNKNLILMNKVITQSFQRFDCVFCFY